MIISITNPTTQTFIFIVIFVIAILLSLRSKKLDGFFPISTTNELKGLAILTVIFGHIGYFLISGNLFLFPLSTMSGMGVDLFLFLSGYGLTVSAIKKSRTIGNFYRDRLLKLLIPFWLVLGIFFLLDFFILNKAYPTFSIISSFLGFFPTADLYNDINSPLWYFTFILFYYFIFPLVFIKKKPWLSAIIIYVVSYIIINFNFSFISQVRYFYETHYWAFPIGVLAGGILCNMQVIQGKFANFISKIKNGKLLKVFVNILYWLIILGLLFAIIYASYSGMGRNINMERLVSTLVALTFVLLFLMKKIEIRLFSLLGIYSYEIYLLHWPILYRYDMFFKFLPAWLSMVLYLILFVILGWLLKKTSEIMVNKF
ncbi:MAG: acyltransferase [Candidatus Paceibacterota bacterium]|jgi:peptidoglycan/LPS O-acetylase OafA/YrhL